MDRTKLRYTRTRGGETIPKEASQASGRRSGWKLAAAKLFLRVTGWEAEGRTPAARSYVLISAPHTSNWDLAFMLALSVVMGVKLSWMGKAELFRGPLGAVMRWTGGVPVRRERRSDMVQQIASVFEESDALVLAIAPEGTRSYAPHWKSGFYRIAQAAGVPIVMGYLDYARKRGGLGPELILTDDVRHDMDEIRAFYADKTGLRPECFGEVRLKEEG